MAESDFYIPSEAIRLIDDDGSTNIPTVLLYDDKGVHIGNDALRLAHWNRYLLNEDFKLDLGLSDPKSREPRKNFAGADGTPKSADDLAADFLRYVLAKSEVWLTSHNLKKVDGVYIAEPLAMNADIVPKEWLEYYRSKLRSIFQGQGVPRDNIHFLPEPFAVYQYYRYASTHPLLYTAISNRVLVVDFGGGTFDVCIIETAKKGEVKGGGKNSRPLAAASAPYGGFFINRKVCESLLYKSIPKSQHSKLRRSISAYDRWRKDGRLDGFDKESITFIKHFHNLIYAVERPKIALAQQIADWSLTSVLAQVVSVKFPRSPFNPTTDLIDVPFSASEFRSLFLNEVWRDNLKPIIESTLRRGKEALGTEAVNLVLLSGGSASIGWLRNIMLEEMGGSWPGATILSVGNYQEVVAKGLALQSAKKFHTEELEDISGVKVDSIEFTATTYNPLSVVVRADEHPPELVRLTCKEFQPKAEAGQQAELIPQGLLLRSGTDLARVVDHPLTWKFKMTNPPRHRLEYYFTRSVIDSSLFSAVQKGESVLQSALLHDIYNFEEQSVSSPRNIGFDSSLKLELIIDANNVARPTFVYREGTEHVGRIEKEGRPFCVDMVSALPPQDRKPDVVYLGIDFGTSNRSVSFIRKQDIQAFKVSETEIAAGGLPGLCHRLPYPVADPLARYLAAASEAERFEDALEFVEAALMTVAYVTYRDLCASSSESSRRLFAKFQQRSARPLWNWSKLLLQAEGVTLTKPFRRLLEQTTLLDSTVEYINDAKHHRAPKVAARLSPAVRALATELSAAFDRLMFGYFENVQKVAFSKQNAGIFRNAVGNPPFYHGFRYVGQPLFSSDEAYVVDRRRHVALPVQPLFFWSNCAKHCELESANGHCFAFDKAESKQRLYTYKAIQYQCSAIASPLNAMRPIAMAIEEMLGQDPKVELTQLDTLEEIEEMASISPTGE